MAITTRESAEKGLCPLVHLPCGQGYDMAAMCRARVQRYFDPASSSVDYAIQQCAERRFLQPRDSLVRFWY